MSQSWLARRPLLAASSIEPGSVRRDWFFLNDGMVISTGSPQVYTSGDFRCNPPDSNL